MEHRLEQMKRKYCIILCLLAATLLMGCDPYLTSSPISFNRPVELSSLHIGKFLYREEKKEGEDTLMAYEIEKQGGQYWLSSVTRSGYSRNQFTPYRIPNTKDFYVFSFDHFTQFTQATSEPFVKARILKNAFYVFQLKSDGTVSYVSLKDSTKGKEWSSLAKITDAYLHDNNKIKEAQGKYQGSSNIYDVSQVKEYLLKHRTIYENSKVPLIAIEDGVLDMLTNADTQAYYALVLPFKVDRLINNNDGLEQTLIATETKRLNQIPIKISQKLTVDRELNTKKNTYLSNSSKYIESISQYENLCDSNAKVSKNDIQCYRYKRVLEFRKLKLKNSDYYKQLVKVGEPKLEQGSNTDSYTYTTPDTSELVGDTLYTYRGRTVTSYDTSINRFAYLHVPIHNGFCSKIKINMTAKFNYNPFNPDDNSSTLGGLLGGLTEMVFRSTVASAFGASQDAAFSDFGIKRASETIEIPPNQSKTLTITLDSEGLVRDGIQMRDAVIEEITMKPHDKGCVQDKGVSSTLERIEHHLPYHLFLMDNAVLTKSLQFTAPNKI